MSQKVVKIAAVLFAAMFMTLAGLGAVAFAQGGGAGPGPGAPGKSYLSAVATTLGMTEADLLTALKSGKSVAAVAAEKNVSLDKVVAAIVTQVSESLKTQVTANRITQAQSDAQVAWMNANLAKLLAIPAAPLGGFGLPGFGGPHDGPGGPGGRAGDANSPFAIAAKSLTMSEADLLTALRGGKSVADLAKEKNVALDTIINAAVAARGEALKAEVTAGRITQAQADTRLAQAKEQITQQFNTQGAPGGPGRGGFPPKSPRGARPTPAPSN